MEREPGLAGVELAPEGRLEARSQAERVAVEGDRGVHVADELDRVIQAHRNSPVHDVAARGWWGTRISVPPSTRQDWSLDRKFMPITSRSPRPGEVTTRRLRATILPTRSSSTLPVCAGAAPLAVCSTTGARPVPVFSFASRAVFAETAVMVAPLSISIRVLTPLTEARTQKWPSLAMVTRNSLPVTCWSSSPSLEVRRDSSG